MVIMTLLFDTAVAAEFSESGLDDGNIHTIAFPYEGFDKTIAKLKAKSISMGCSGPKVYIDLPQVDEVKPRCEELGWSIEVLA
jgi:hypothetical protein